MALGTENLHIGHHQSYSAGQKQQRQRQLAPAPVRSMAPYSKPMSFSSGTTLDSDNPSVIRRNARERNRVKQVNNGFLNLRQHIPQAIVADLSNGRRGIGPGANKKLSKVDTLKMAVEYIRRLQRVIDEVDSGDDATSVSSFGSSNSSFACSSSTASMMNISESPEPQSPSGGYYGHQFMPSSGSFQLQQQQQQQLYTSYPMQLQQQATTLISPTGSTTSSGCSSDSPLYHQPTSAAQFQMKFEDSFDEYQSQHHHQQQQHQQQYQQQNQQHFEQFNDSGSVVEDEELLDYISLWQEDA